MVLRCVLVENQKHHTTRLRTLIEQHSNCKLIESFNKANEVIRHLKNYRFDLLILEVEMSFINGFELFEALSQKPEVIFVSQSRACAQKAIQYHPIDLLVKPIESKAFDVAIERAQKIIYPAPKVLEKKQLVVTNNFKKVVINHSDILWVESVRDYVKIVTETERILILSTLTALASQLESSHFMRIHRSFVVNLEKVTHFNKQSLMVSDTKLPVGKTRRNNLVNFFNNFA